MADGRESDSVRVQTVIPPDHYRELVRRAEENGRTVAAELRFMVREAVAGSRQ